MKYYVFYWGNVAPYTRELFTNWIEASALMKNLMESGFQIHSVEITKEKPE